MKKLINIAQDFSRNPAGRYISDGPFSGENFRENVLLPALKENDLVEIDLNGSLGFGSSFLEEAFGGLVRHSGYSFSDLQNRLSIKSPITTYEKKIWQYIKSAKPIKN